MSLSLDSLAGRGWLPPPTREDGVIYLHEADKWQASYPEDGLAALGLEGGGGYWFDHRAHVICRYLGRLGTNSHWEVGSGTGVVASRLASQLDDVVAVEPRADGARAAARQGLISLCGTLQDCQLPDGSLESVGLYDVIEHLEEPQTLLREVARVVRPGGSVVVTVPALSLLWGSEDDVAGHYRRYTAHGLDREMSSAGLKRIHSEYIFASLVPIAALLRALPYRLGKRPSEAQVLDSIAAQLDMPTRVDAGVRTVLSIEAHLARAVRLPFGLSVIGAYRR